MRADEQNALSFKEVNLLAVRIRMRRMGSKKRPFYRLVVADSRSPRDGRFIEEIGYYNPTVEPKQLQVDEERAIDWLKKGALPSDTVKALLTRVGIYEKLNQSRSI